MTATTATTTAQPRTGPAPTGYARAFLAILWRDIFVTGRELPTFLAQVILQPLFMLFVFGKVLASLGFTTNGYTNLLFPGILALTAFLTAFQATALPLVLEFSFSKEIEDRLLAPLPTHLVAVEKIIFATGRALLATVLMFPIGWLVLGSVSVPASGIPLLVVMLVLGSLVGSAIGLTLGTTVPPAKISIMFAVIMTPLMFTGSIQYPWALLDRLRWFQVVSAFNPLTYFSEGLRAAMVPSVQHVHPWVSTVLLIGFLALFTATGVRGFLRRAID